MPDWPTGSSAEPLRYQIMCVTTGTRWSGMTTTSSPLSRVKDDTSGPPPSVRPKGAASVRSVGWRRTVSAIRRRPRDMAKSGEAPASALASPRRARCGAAANRLPLRLLGACRPSDRRRPRVRSTSKSRFTRHGRLAEAARRLRQVAALRLLHRGELGVACGLPGAAGRDGPRCRSRTLSPRRIDRLCRDAGAGPAAGCGSPRSRGSRSARTRRRSVCVTGVRRVGLAAPRGGDVGIVRPLRVRGVDGPADRRDRAAPASAAARAARARDSRSRRRSLRDDARSAEEVLGEHAFLGAGAGRREERRGGEERCRAREVEDFHGTPPVSFLRSRNGPGDPAIRRRCGDVAAFSAPRPGQSLGVSLQREARAGLDTRSGLRRARPRAARGRASHRGARPPRQRWPRRRR